MKSILQAMDVNLKDKAWWRYLEADLQELFTESLVLVDIFEKRNEEISKEEFEDYSFIVFPAAKAYEGFLKKIFLDLGFINREQYYGKHLRIGKSLSPYLPKDLERESVYKKLVDYCGGEKLAENLWETWKTSRNLVFHWFPDEKNAINFSEAKEKISLIISAIDLAFEECRLGKDKTL